MKCRLVAAGTRLPDWINAGFEEYRRRLVRPMSLELHEIPVTSTPKEAERMLAAIGRDDYVVALEVTGKSMDTPALASWLEQRLGSGRGLTLLVGGPDGLAPACLARADARWSLSPLTLPHALVRVIVAEQLYRAISIQAGHPYHRA